MRALFSVSAAVCCLTFASCSSQKVTKADLAAFKLRDLTRFGQPHLVKVSKTEVAQLEQAERKSGQLASLAPRHQARIPSQTFAPVDDVNYVPPTLPRGSVVYDGSILPPKTAGHSAALDISGSIPGQSYTTPAYPVPVFPSSQPQNFSIE